MDRDGSGRMDRATRNYKQVIVDVRKLNLKIELDSKLRPEVSAAALMDHAQIAAINEEVAQEEIGVEEFSPRKRICS